MKKLQWSVIILGVLCIAGMIWFGTQVNNFDDVRQEQYIRIIFVFLFSAFSLFTIAYLCGKIKNKRRMHLVTSLIAGMSFVLIFPYAITPDRIPFRYTYESSDEGLSLYEHLGGKSEWDKSIEFPDIKIKFAEYLKKSGKKDIVLCRTFKKDDRVRWYHFYTWLRYNTQECWQLPYKTPKEKDEFKKQAKKSLKELLLRTNSDSFVIFSEPKTGKYCQLATDKNGLFFDLPFLPLSKVEIKRAEVVLAKHGIPKAVYCRMYDSSGKDKKEVEGWKAFQKKLGNDVDAATKIVIAVFTEVYQFDPNTKFKIEEN